MCWLGLSVAERVSSDRGIDRLLASVVFAGGTDDGSLDIVVEGEEELGGGSLTVRLDEFLHGGWLDELDFHLVCWVWVWVERLVDDPMLGLGAEDIVVRGDVPRLNKVEGLLRLEGELLASLGGDVVTSLAGFLGASLVLGDDAVEFGTEPDVVFEGVGFCFGLNHSRVVRW